MLELEELFNKFDDDKSGTLDMTELYQMFKQAGIQISQKDLRMMFQVDILPGGSALSLKMFQERMLSNFTNECFSRLVRQLREKEPKDKDGKKVYIPQDLNVLLNQLSMAQEEEEKETGFGSLIPGENNPEGSPAKDEAEEGGFLSKLQDDGNYEEKEQ